MCIIKRYNVINNKCPIKCLLKKELKMKIPKDPYILLSFINTKLRDEYHSLEDLCKSLNINQLELEDELSAIDYTYVSEQNRFIAAF
jgi:hypothetical protein